MTIYQLTTDGTFSSDCGTGWRGSKPREAAEHIFSGESWSASDWHGRAELSSGRCYSDRPRCPSSSVIFIAHVVIVAVVVRQSTQRRLAQQQSQLFTGRRRQHRQSECPGRS